MENIIYIPLDNSIPKTIAQWLCSNFVDAQIPTYFDNSLVIVPTKSAVKNLRAEILNTLAKKGIKAMSGLTITTLEHFISKITTSTQVATLPERIAAWLQALEETKEYSAIFKNGRPPRECMLETAKELEKLKSILSEKPYTFSDVYNFLNSNSNFEDFEISIWKELKFLETEYKKALGDKKCKYDALIEALKNAETEYKRIAIAANADIPSNTKVLLNALAKKSQTYILVASNASKDNFDELGRPKPNSYSEKPIDISEKNTFVYTSVEDEAESVAKIAMKYADKACSALSVSCEQTKNADIFITYFNKYGMTAYIPENRKLSQSALFKLLKASAICKENDMFSRFFEVLINPLMSNYIANKTGIEKATLLKCTDELRERFVPTTSQKLINILTNRNEIDIANTYILINETMSNLTSSDAIKVLNTAQDIMAVVETIPNFPIDFEQEALEVLKSTAEEIAKIKIELLPNEVNDLLLNSLDIPSSETKNYENAIALNNWIEIFWSNKRHLLLCDINDGTVPLTESENQFLTDNLKQRLGLRNSQIRRARDAYMLETLLQTRPNSTNILYSLKDASEAPIMPSRILMQADDKHLASRIKFLFTEPICEKMELSAPTPIPLKVNKKLPENFSMSASKFNTYLNSPIEFYVNYILQASEVAPNKTELDALQYGTIFHSIMGKFAISKYKNSQNSQEIYSYLNACINEFQFNEFGNELSAEVRIQLYTMRQKLAAVANVQAQRAIDGWQIFEKPEWRFSIDINGMRTVGSIDRIDYNPNLDKYCIIDYKTYSKFELEKTKKTHYKNTDETDKPIWENLQMPLYVLAFNKKMHVNSQCAYFISPNDTASTAIDTWDISEQELNYAEEKMGEIITDIKNEIFMDDTKPQYEMCSNTFNLSTKAFTELLQK